MKLLVLNGAARGAGGNTSRALAHALCFVPPDVVTETVDLARFDGSVAALFAALDDADAFLVGSGVYWGSVGTPLQRFFEVATAREATSTFVGKPVACVLTLDGIGGFEVAARVLATFNLFGCVVPPFASALLSRVGIARGDDVDFADLWQPDDLAVVVENLLHAARARRAAPVRTWAVKELATLSGPYPAPGALELASPRFLVETGAAGPDARRRTDDATGA